MKMLDLFIALLTIFFIFIFIILIIYLFIYDIKIQNKEFEYEDIIFIDDLNKKTKEKLYYDNNTKSINKSKKELELQKRYIVTPLDEIIIKKNNNLILKSILSIIDTNLCDNYEERINTFTIIIKNKLSKDSKKIKIKKKYSEKEVISLLKKTNNFNERNQKYVKSWKKYNIKHLLFEKIIYFFSLI